MFHLQTRIYNLQSLYGCMLHYCLLSLQASGQFK